MKLNQKPYSIKAATIASSIIQFARPVVILDGFMRPGMRFKCDKTVSAILESLAEEKSFLGDPMRFATVALMDAASADYWYDEEKKYDCDAPEDNDERAYA